jgi:hypothetical protein
MSETLRDHTLAWLDSIGADGLMHPRTNKLAWSLEDIKAYIVGIDPQLVPAYRHADGSYHTEKEVVKDPCAGCIYDSIDGDSCEQEGGICDEYVRYRLAAKSRGVTPEQIVVEE